MKAIIKELLDELMDYQNMKTEIEFIHLKIAAKKAESFMPLSWFVDWVYGRDKDVIKDYSPEYLPVDSEYKKNNWRIIFDTTPPLTELIKFEDNKIQWADGLTVEELEEIKAYITERYQKEDPFMPFNPGLRPSLLRDKEKNKDI